MTTNVTDSASSATSTQPGNGAELICRSLTRAGVDVIFGVPGDTGVGLYDAFYATPTLQHVLMNDERGAVFAADAYARRTNRVGVVEVSSGGGATFCIGGLGEALAASVPLVVISSDIDSRSRNSGALTETDQMALFSGVTKWRAQAESAAELPALIEEAFRAAVSGRPGPAVVIVPENLLDESASVSIDFLPLSLPPHRLKASPDQVQAIAAAISTAERPAVVVGGGVHVSSAYAALEKFATAVGAPVATTIHGKGAIADSHPLSLGVVGANGGRDYATDWIAASDFVLFVGTRANATDTDGFRAPAKLSRVTTVAIIDIDDRAKAIHNFPEALVATGDAATVLSQLTQAVSVRDDISAITEEIANLSQAWGKRVYARKIQPDTLDPWHVMERVQALLPANTTILADCGTPTPYLGAMWEVGHAGKTVVTPRGHGPMGYALPASVGAAFADPDRHILTFTTDGSLVMAAGALETVARNQLPIIFVHFSNGSLGWIKALQHFYHERRYFRTQISRFDAVSVASGFGLDALRVETLDEVSEAIKAAIKSGRPTFIDVPTPDEHDALPPVASWERVESGLETTRPVY